MGLNSVSPDPLYKELYEFVKDIKLGDKVKIANISLLLSNEFFFG